ncbi:glycosyltransferase [Azospirillum sp. SYSU D00513]|uniref:glycosyltransferase n=1 Tax=Azospirillum sp. SYSU D00513 TaxID=2812561 RepID=UPI001A95A9F2|nr:glycosyltransferase [Azospirillum sp. SYSU D00513]
MVQHLVAFGPTLLCAAFFLLFAWGWPRHKTWTRAVVCLFVFLVAFRYLVWRFTDTVLPHPQDGSFSFWWTWFVFAVEILAFSDILLFLVTMGRHVDRSREADSLEARFFAQPRDRMPDVDVFIPTYNEPLDVLERTIVGALALDYPGKVTVYVLDDKRRDWLRAFCEEKGAVHVTRSDNSHAKAGNMNNGLRVSSGAFIAIFDADFVPYRNFLRRTLGFFLDPGIGIVQTPQHFFNKDPVQLNLSLERHWPDEQRLFFDEMAASRDAWDVSFCCGSCSIIRREAVETIGGFPTESITEDLLTTLALLNKGYTTRYLNERLSMGLAAENLKGYFVQRGRWCRGGIQTLFLHNGPIFGPGLNLFQRIMFLPLSWLVQYLVRFVILIVPAVYLWTGVAPLYFTGSDALIAYQIPLLLSYFLLMRWITPTRYMPVLSSAVGAFGTFRMLPVVVASLIKPFGTPFRVTPKGSGNEENEFDLYSFAAISLLIAVTALGLFLNLVPEWSRIGRGEFSVIAAYWAGINIIVLFLAAMICFEAPRPLAESFDADEPGRLEGEGRPLRCRITGLSLAGFRCEIPAGEEAPFAGALLTARIAEIPPVTARVERAAALKDGRTRLDLVFPALEGEARDRMIVKLYTGGYSQDIRELDRSEILRGLWRRAFGARRSA